MNVDKNIKMLLIKLNMSGKETSLVKYLRFNEHFKTISTYYTLTFWTKIKRVSRITGQLEEKNIGEPHKFSSAAELLKFMVVKSNE